MSCSCDAADEPTRPQSLPSRPNPLSLPFPLAHRAYLLPRLYLILPLHSSSFFPSPPPSASSSRSLFFVYLGWFGWTGQARGSFSETSRRRRRRPRSYPLGRPGSPISRQISSRSFSTAICSFYQLYSAGPITGCALGLRKLVYPVPYHFETRSPLSGLLDSSLLSVCNRPYPRPHCTDQPVLL